MLESVTSVYEFVKDPLIKIFSDSTNFGIFPENMKIAKVKPNFKSGKSRDLEGKRLEIAANSLVLT